MNVAASWRTGTPYVYAVVRQNLVADRGLNRLRSETDPPIGRGDYVSRISTIFEKSCIVAEKIDFLVISLSVTWAGLP